MEQKQVPQPVVSSKKHRIKLALRIAIGALIGYGFYLLVGCPSGGCAFAATPYIPTALGALIAYVTSSYPEQEDA